MIRKILCITILAAIPLFFLNCSNSGNTGEKTAVTIDLGGNTVFNSSTGTYEIQKAAGTTSALPTDIDTIQIKVTGADKVLYDETFNRTDIADSADSITLEIPSGNGLIFTVSAYDQGGTLRYSGSSSAVDIIADSEISVTVTLKEAVLQKDAAITLNLKELDSSGQPITFANKTTYFRTTNTIKAEVIIPDVVKTVDQDGNTQYNATSVPVNDLTTSFTSSITGLTAYPNTFQLITVKVFSADGTLAAIGAAVKTNLSSDTNNQIDVILLPPGRIVLTNNTNINSYLIEMDFGSGFVPVASSNTSLNSSTATILVPNCRTEIGKTDVAIGIYTKPRDVRITVNGDPKTQVDAEIEWKKMIVNFQEWTWTKDTSLSK